MALNFIEDLSITGNVSLPDSSNLKLGDGQDLELFHGGTDSYIQNVTGHLNIINYADDKDIIFKNDDGSGGITEYLRIDGGVENVRFLKEAKFGDNVKLKVGEGGDLQIYHSGTNSEIQSKTGNLNIKATNTDGDIKFFLDDGSGSTTQYVRMDGGEEQTLFLKETEHQDSIKARFGNGGDLNIFHDSTDSKIENDTGDLIIRNNADDSRIRFQCDDGSGGVSTYFDLQGSQAGARVYTNWYDDSVITLGNGLDIQIYHDATDSHFYNQTGDLYFKQATDDKDIIFQCDDSSGGLTDYYRIDGANHANRFYKNLALTDDVAIYWGNSNDFYIKHNATNTEVINSTGDLLIENYQDDGDISFKSDDGSGGIATYMYLDGGNTRVQFNKDARFVDAAKILIGTGDDGQIYSSSDDLYIDQTTADKDIIFRADAGDGSTTTYFYLDGSGTNGSSVTGATVFPDASKIYLGTGKDMEIFHNGSQAYIENYTSTMNFTNHANDADMNFKCDDGSGGTATYFFLDGSAVRTTSNKNLRFIDSARGEYGDSGDLAIYHNGTTNNIEAISGKLRLIQSEDDGDISFESDDGSGGLAEYFKLDGTNVRTLVSKNFNLEDDVILQIGNSQDLRLYHNGSHSYIAQAGAGNLYIQNEVDDADIVFLSDDGSGGTTTYFYLDGSQSNTNFQKDIIFADSKKALFGGSGDLQIYHDGSNSYIDETGTGSLYIKSAGAIRLQSDTGENMIYAVNDGAVNLYHNNVKTFETTASGIEVTGLTDTDSLLIGTSTTVTAILDEDNMASDSATALATQQSIKAYVDNSVTGVLTYQGTWNANTNTPTLSSGSGTPGYYYIVSVAGSTDLDGITDWAAGDWAVFSDLATDAWQKIDNTAVGNVSGSGANNRLVLWSGTSTVDSDSSFYMSGTTLYAPNLTIGGTLSATSDLTFDVTGDITLDAAGNDIRLFKSGVEYGKFKNDSSDLSLYSSIQDKDILFKGNDDGSTITALQLDMSDAGYAYFNSGISAGAASFSSSVNIADSIYHVGDTNTSFGFVANDTIAFTTAGTEAVRIDANGDVGIGTADPLKKLHIIGPDGVSGSTSGNTDTALLIDNDGSNGAIIELMASNDSKGSIFFTDEDAANRGAITYGHTNDDLAILTAATTALTINSSQAATFTGDVQAAGIYVGATNTSYDLYNNGTSYFNGNVTVNANLTVDAGSISISGDGSNAATLTESASGDFEIHAADDLRLNADGHDIVLKGASNEFGRLTNSSQDFVIRNTTSDKDIIFKGKDDTTVIDALTLDMSEGGNATFAGTLTIPSYIYHTSDPSDDTYFGFSGNDTFVVYTAGGSGLNIDSNRAVTLTGTLTGTSATFSGDVILDDGSGNSPNLKFVNGSDDDFEYYINSSGKLILEQANTQRAEWSSGGLELANNLLVPSGYVGRDGDNYIGFITDNLIKFRVNGATQVKLSDGLFAPQTDSDVDLGSNGVRFKDAYIDTITTTGNVSVGGTITTGDDGSVIGGDGVVSLYARSTGTVSYIQIQNSDTGTNTTSDGLTIGNNGTTAYVWQREAASLLLGTNDTAALTIDSSQNATFAGNVHLDSDSAQLQLGDDNDMQVYHNGSNGFVKVGTGDLILQSDGDDIKILSEDDVVIRDNDDSTNMAQFINGGAVELYHNGSKKFETTSTGADIDGTLTLDTLAYGGSATTALGFGMNTFSFSNASGTIISCNSSRTVSIEENLIVSGISSDADITITGADINLNNNANIALDPSVSSGESSGTIIKIGTHMSALVAGNIYYMGNSMGSPMWYGADADSSSTKNMMALSLGTDADVDGMLLNGIYHKASHGFTVGLPLYLSNTTMTMTNTAPTGSGDYVRILGYAIDSNHIYFCPDNTWVEVA